MYIKTKYIKNTLLIFACVFFAGFNYLTYVNADSVSNVANDLDKDGLTDAEEKLYGTNPENADSDNDGYSDGVEVKSGYDPLKPSPGDRIVTQPTETTASTQEIVSASVTATFSQDLKSFIATKGDTPISSSDVNNFVAEKLADKVGTKITLDSLPEVDDASIKILDQKYPLLGEAERKQQIKDDASEYYTGLMYLILSNSPRTINTQSDLDAFNEDFLNHVYSLSSTNPDYAYFSDLGDRLEVILGQLSDMNVPETILPMHEKMIRITKGFLLLENDPTYSNDPISKMAQLSKIQELVVITADFLEGDVVVFLNQL